jgi:chromate transporter
MQIGCLAFGGAQAWSRRVLVENRRWLTERDYAELLGLAQVLPGPNIGNLSVMLGRRFHGLGGSLAALSGFFGLPLILLVGLVTLYSLYGQRPEVNAFMRGTAAAAAGMTIGTALRMGQKLRPPPEAIGIAVAVALAAAWARFPLPLIVLVAGPLGIALSLRRAWRAAAAEPGAAAR